MAKHYGIRPSEVIGIPSGYLGYCVDEVAYFLEINAMDKKGNLNWNKIKWSDNEVGGNKNLIDFIEGR